MGLQMTIENPNGGADYEGAYFRIDSLTIGRECVVIRVKGYANKTAADSYFPEISDAHYYVPEQLTDEQVAEIEAEIGEGLESNINPDYYKFKQAEDGGNALMQAYDYLKSLTDFEDAVDQ